MAAPGDGGGELFTRGGRDQPDLRGLSMVAKHQDNLQKEKERKAMEKLRVVLPQISPALHALALQEFNWDEEQAAQALRKFSMVKAAELKALAKERLRHAEKKASRATKKRRVADSDSGSGSSSGSESESGSSGSDGSASEDSREDRKKRHRSSGKKRSRSEKRDKKDSSRSKKRRRERKEKDKDKDRRRKEKKSKKDKKEKRRSGDKDRDKDKARAKNPHALQEYGKYGIIRETDLYNKRPEFMLWASEVKKADVEVMPRFEEKEMFKTYMEDYNTGTLPHRKYYDLETYERQQAAKGASGGGGGGGQERMAFDDEAERRKEIAVQRQKDKEERLRTAYEELQTTDKAEDMRQQELMRAKMALAYRTGDVKEAQRLAERLKPDDKMTVAPPPRAPATGT